MNKKEVYLLFGKRIKKSRKHFGQTQSELASKIGVSVTYISSIERGISFPRGEKLVDILNALDVSADSVFCDIVNASFKEKSCLLYDMIKDLPSREQIKILEVVQLLVSQRKDRCP